MQVIAEDAPSKFFWAWGKAAKSENQAAYSIATAGGFALYRRGLSGGSRILPGVPRSCSNAHQQLRNGISPPSVRCIREAISCITYSYTCCCF